MGRGRNIISRKKIQEALSSMPDPFTSRQMAEATGMETKRAQGLLRGHEGVEMIPTKKNRNYRCMWRVIDV